MSASLVVCVLTPPGRGAVATIALVGSSATEVIGRFLHCGPKNASQSVSQNVSHASIASAPVGQIRLGAWRSADGEHVVVCRQSADSFEIHCHGGLAAIEAIVADLVEAGAQRVAWPDHVAAESPGRIKAQAQVALANARTERTAAILLDQYRGALADELRAARDEIARGALEPAKERLRTLIARWRVGSHLTQPYRVTLAGPPNVGKSSLINALVGYRRAIVHDQPGTTRDVLTAQTAIDGWPVELCDTAGVRDSDDELEQAGVSLAWSVARRSDLVLLVRDASSPSRAVEAAFRAELPTALVVRNKCDLLTTEATNDEADEISTSALTGAGIDRLLAAIASRLVPFDVPAGAAVPFTIEQVHAIKHVSSAAQKGDALLASSLLSCWID